MTLSKIVLREIERQRWLDEFNQITQIYSDIITIALYQLGKEKRSKALVLLKDIPITWWYHCRPKEYWPHMTGLKNGEL